MSETTIIGGVAPGGLGLGKDSDPPRWPTPAPTLTPTPAPASATGLLESLPRGLLACLGGAMLGVLLLLAGLAVDAALHARDPGAHDEASLFSLSNPGHVLLLIGGVVTVAGLTAATVRAMSASSRPFVASRITSTALVTSVVVLAAGTAGAMQWAATAQPPIATGPLAPVPGADGHGLGIVNSHDPGPCRPTAAQKAAAAKLVSDTELATAKYRNFDSAVADGYVGPANPTLTEHYSSTVYSQDGKVLDPARPESLLYTPTSRGMVLVAAMYMMNVPGEFGPEPGGCLTRWHVHTNVCFSSATFGLAGVLAPGQTCGLGTFHWVPPPVLHVWFLDVPGGRFAAEVDAGFLANAVGP